MGIEIEKLGVVGNDIVTSFSLSISPDTPIFIGLNNRIHMENTHKEIYQRYYDCMSDIITYPDYVGLNPQDNSLEYYKNYDGTILHIKLAVRPTNNGIYYARTLFEINNSKLQSYLKKGRIKPIDNSV